MGLLKILFLSSLFFFTLDAANAEKIIDVSGIWQLEYEGQQIGCQDPNKNRSRKGLFSFAVEQEGNALSSTFLDRGITHILIGEIIGDRLNITISGFDIKGCKNVTFLTGKLGKPEGYIVNGNYSGKDISCDTCTWEGKFNVLIIW